MAQFEQWLHQRSPSANVERVIAVIIAVEKPLNGLNQALNNKRSFSYKFAILVKHLCLL